jgi:hypothetical protein
MNIIWETWKTNIIKAATNAIGMEKKVKHHKHFWDKELDGLSREKRQTDRNARMMQLYTMTVNYVNY